MNALKLVLYAFGFFFMIVGLALLISADPAFELRVAPLYSGVVLLFYAFLAVIMLALFIHIVLVALGKKKLFG